MTEWLEVLRNPELAEVQDICRGRCTLIMDEFYSGYQYDDKDEYPGATISSAANIKGLSIMLMLFGQYLHITRKEGRPLMKQE